MGSNVLWQPGALVAIFGWSQGFGVEIMMQASASQDKNEIVAETKSDTASLN